MVAEPTTPIDLEDLPTLARLIDELMQSRRPREIRRGGETIALLVPTAPKRRAGRRAGGRIPALPPPRYKNIEEMMADRGPAPARAFTEDEIKEALDQDRADAWRAKCR